MPFNRDDIKKYLIESAHSQDEASDFFKNNLNSNDLLMILLEIVSDDYSGDARMEASYWISQFDNDLLKGAEMQLLEVQKDELDSIASHILIALGKIKSKEGLKYLIENRIKPDLYWEAEALRYHLDDLLS